jgi:hypothetical protein
VDVRFPKQKQEQFKPHKFKSNIQMAQFKKEALNNGTLKKILLEMPVGQLTASLNEAAGLDLAQHLNRNFERFIIKADTTPTSEVDSLKKALLKAQIKLLKLEQDQIRQSYETGGVNMPTRRRDPRQEKANKMGGASLLFSILAGLLFIPALSAATGGLFVLVILFDLLAIGIGIASLVKFGQTDNKNGKWKAILGLSLVFGIPLVLFLLLILFLLIFWQGF